MSIKDQKYIEESELNGEKIFIEMKTSKSHFLPKPIKITKERKMFNADTYTPKVHDKRVFPVVEVLLKAKLCGLCKSPMLQPMDRYFPQDTWSNQKEQMIRGGIKEQSRTNDCNGNPVCIDCKESGKIEFTCQLCQRKKPSSKIQESIGDPADYLCSDCYETCPAKIWDSKVEELNSEHKYDYE